MHNKTLISACIRARRGTARYRSARVVAVRSGNIREDASVNVAGNIGKAEAAKERALWPNAKNNGPLLKINIFTRKTDSAADYALRDVFGLHEGSLFCNGNGERRSALVVTLAPLLFANLHTPRSRASAASEERARGSASAIALFMNSFILALERATGRQRLQPRRDEERFTYMR